MWVTSLPLPHPRFCQACLHQLVRSEQDLVLGDEANVLHVLQSVTQRRLSGRCLWQMQLRLPD